ncbi:GNAT family N-acetyltransferase [Neobacillus massiliamazoniensis]|uniref:Acetyltransferase n=1 Tax=Neobacillus massiliamazoniensis TaxID=1499688 RepID=A0A0U1NS04_9BACI|nr:GNAT family N-acetyltransferase [Neobacillus massiliamazoniensis]CRK80839.1 acetyltransferase [Neobacillus massiliamazoniensis]
MLIDERHIRYQRSSEVNESFIHQAFLKGFSDYIVKMEISEEDFLKRFFGPEGNKAETSFIAFYKEEPAGVILGGIKNYETIKTMRCGALAISPEYRGTGISQRLFELHKDEAIKHGCKQLFLEVIVGNDRAINFYKKLGYEKIYDLVYFTNEDLSQFKNANTVCDIKKINFEDFQSRVANWSYHINWQNDIDYLKEIPTIHYYVAFQNGGVAGYLAINPIGNIHFLMIDKNFRGKGIGRQLLKTASTELSLTKMSTGFPNNSLLEGFLKKLGFTKGTLAQYEMYRIL